MGEIAGEAASNEMASETIVGGFDFSNYLRYSSASG